MANCNVLVFVPNSKAVWGLTHKDKTDVWYWEQTSLSCGYDQAVIQAQAWVQGVEQDEFVLIYRLGHPWARWGVARQGHKVMVWRCSDGVTAGLYFSMKSALDELPHASTAYSGTTFSATKFQVAQLSS